MLSSRKSKLCIKAAWTVLGLTVIGVDLDGKWIRDRCRFIVLFTTVHAYVVVFRDPGNHEKV